MAVILPATIGGSEGIDATTLLGFAAVALGMVLTPGPNMAYLVSRAICQGPRAGLISLAGVALAFLVYMSLAALGITAILMAVPLAYDTLRIAGACYLLYLAWNAVRPGGRSPFEVRALAPDGAGRLFAMGFLTNLLNPKTAVMYLSLLPQFVRPDQGSVLGQSLVLGLVQIAVSMAVNGLIILSAGGFARLLNRHPAWIRAQRWVMGTVLAGLGLRMLTEARR